MFRWQHIVDFSCDDAVFECVKSQIFEPEFAQIWIGARRLYRDVLI